MSLMWLMLPAPSSFFTFVLLTTQTEEQDWGYQNLAKQTGFSLKMSVVRLAASCMMKDKLRILHKDTKYNHVCLYLIPKVTCLLFMILWLMSLGIIKTPWGRTMNETISSGVVLYWTLTLTIAHTSPGRLSQTVVKRMNKCRMNSHHHHHQSQV